MQRTFELDDERRNSLQYGDGVELNGDVARLGLIENGRRGRATVGRETARRQRLSLARRPGTCRRDGADLVAEARPGRAASRRVRRVVARVRVFRARLPDERHQRQPGQRFTRSTVNYCWWRGTVVERRSLAGELSLSCARPAADG